MSAHDVNLIRRIYEDGLLEHDPAELLALASPEIEYVNPPEAIEGGVRRGLDEVAEVFAELSRSFESTRYEVDGLFDAGESVVAWVRFLARGRGSAAEAVQMEAHTWTFAEGAIVRFEWGRDLDAALAAAGISR